MKPSHLFHLKKSPLHLKGSQEVTWPEKLLDLAAHLGPCALRFSPLRKYIVSTLEESLHRSARKLLIKGDYLPGVIMDRLDMSLAILYSIERALADGRLGERTAPQARPDFRW